MLKDKLIDLKRELVDYAALIEQMVNRSIQGLNEKNSTLLNKVINDDEEKANEWEMIIDDLCTSIIARYVPEAKDLRTVLMILRMNNDLERLGDHAVNIAQSGLFLIQQTTDNHQSDITILSKKVVTMLGDSIHFFLNEDASKARTICIQDQEVDALKTKIFKELTGIMAHDPTTIERSLQYIRIINNLERIADLSTNICEDVVFMTEGKVIKHHKEDKHI